MSTAPGEPAASPGPPGGPGRRPRPLIPPRPAPPGQRPATWADLLERATEELGSRPDARRLVEAASGLSGADLMAGLGDLVTARAGNQLMEMIQRRRRGEPLQYVCGSWGFRRLDLMVDPRVLIPRPETEVLVEAALEELARLRAGREGAEPLVVVDLGTGSGALALALADEAPGVAGEIEVWATDLSAEALQVASANLAGLAGSAAPRVRLREGDWWAALPEELAGRVDLVVSNPPYVAEADVLDAEVSGWEPAGALWSGPSGLEATEAILQGAPRWLGPGSALVLELATERAEQTLGLVRDHGWEASLRADLTGRARLVVGRRGSPGRDR